MLRGIRVGAFTETVLGILVHEETVESGDVKSRRKGNLARLKY